jgi:hypothetical protein
MRKLIISMLLLISTISIAQTPSNTDWVEIDENAKYQIIDTRDDMLMFRFVFAYRDEAIDRYTLSFWYVDCSDSKASAFRHQYYQLSTNELIEDEIHPVMWVDFGSGTRGSKVVQAECVNQLNRIKASPTAWKHYTK